MQNPNSKMLSDIVVLDLSRILAGPWATQVLADYGANVIKVERPLKGDDTRHWGPPNMENGDAAYFHAANRNKKSITVDFTKPEGAELIRELAQKADIVVENYKVGGLKKYNLDADSLMEINPSLVYCSITGFGQAGPLSSRAGYDFLVQGMGGLMSITGQKEGQAGAEPMKVGVAVADLFTGLYASNAILAALWQAKSTGRGAHIDVALLDCQLAMLANQAMNYLSSGEAPVRLGNAHPNIVPYQVFESAEGHFILAVGNDNQFVNLCELLGKRELAEDDRFKTNASRVKNRDSLIPLLQSCFYKREAVEWIKSFEEVGVPCGPIHSVEEALESDHAQQRNMIVSLESEGGIMQRYVNHPVHFNGAALSEHNLPPSLGADTEEILKDMLGKSAGEISDLVNTGVL